MRSKVIITAIIATLMFAGLAAIKHIDNLNDGIQLKQIEIQDNSVKLKLLNEKYEKLNQDKSLDKKEYEKQLKQLEKEKQKLESDLQAKLDAKNRAVAQVTAGAAQTASAASQVGSGTCPAIVAKLAALGVPSDQLTAAGQLAFRESTCDEYVTNEIGACGAFQSLPCGKWGATASDSYYRGAIAYANSTYGGYNGALAHSLAYNWY